MAEPIAVASFLGLAALAAGADVVGGLLALRLRPGQLDTRYIIAFSSGIVLSAAFFELMPESLLPEDGVTDPAVIASSVQTSLLLMAVGFFVFYLVEKAVMLHSCGESECETHGATWVSVAGMAGDNIIDGVGIAVGFIVDPMLGVTITLAVLAHEVPQGMTSAEILRKMGIGPRRTIGIVALAGVMYVLGAGLSLVIPADWHHSVIAFVAGVFLYVGSADLLAEAHKRFNVQVIASVVGGAMFMFFLINLAEKGNMLGA